MATSSYESAPADERYDVAGGGWIAFAAVLLGLAGTFNWSLAMFDVVILIVYGLVVYAGHRLRT